MASNIVKSVKQVLGNQSELKDKDTNLNRAECMVTAQFHGLGILGLGTRLVNFQETLKPKVTYVTR